MKFAQFVAWLSLYQALLMAFVRLRYTLRSNSFPGRTLLPRSHPVVLWHRFTWNVIRRRNRMRASSATRNSERKELLRSECLFCIIAYSQDIVMIPTDRMSEFIEAMEIGQLNIVFLPGITYQRGNLAVCWVRETRDDCAILINKL